ncbi:MAG: leucine-rich repeat domain-containing protein [Clostridia bacterium]|nr:leucine-rich repeat domain-containing protein [Clostridia bacterium]
MKNFKVKLSLSVCLALLLALFATTSCGILDVLQDVSTNIDSGLDKDAITVPSGSGSDLSKDPTVGSSSIDSGLVSDSSGAIDSNLINDSLGTIDSGLISDPSVDNPTPELPHEHTYGGWSTIQEPSCTEPGLRVKSCGCGVTKTEEIDATGHTEEIIPGKEATCKETGLTAGKKCSTCGEIIVEQETVLVGDHFYVDQICKFCGKDVSSTGLAFTMSNDGEYAILSGIGDCWDKEIYIPSVYRNLPVRRIESCAFQNKTYITGIHMSNSITMIDSDSFKGCTGLKNITISNSITTFDTSLFADCTSLNNVCYSGTIEQWCNISFPSVESNPLHSGAQLSLNGKVVSDVVLPETVTAINSYAFYGCTSLKKIMLHNNVVSIGNCAFDNCASLKSNEHKNAYYLGTEDNPYFALINICDTSVQKITVSNDTVVIQGGVLRDCHKLESLDLPFVGGYLNATRDSIETTFIYIFGTSSFSGGISIKPHTTFCKDTAYYIPTSLKNVSISGGNILYAAFYNCSTLTSISIPNKVTSIHAYAFSGCSSLTNFYVPNSVTSIYECAFMNCSSLTYFTIPDSVTNLRSGVFRNCTSLKKLIVGKGVTSVCHILGGCSNLESLTIPTIGQGTKASATTLFGYIFDDVSYDGSTEVNQFYADSQYKKYYIPSSLKTVTLTGGNIYYGAFSNCSMLTNIVLDDGVKSIGDYAFYYCIGLSTIQLPSTVTSIGAFAFYNCEYLSKVNIPSNIVSIGNCAFAECERLNDVSIPHGVTSIGRSAFSNCTSLTAIDIPNSVTELGYYAFDSCHGLQSITLSNNLTKLEHNTFRDCTKLSRITIPNGVKSIETSAFNGCTELTDVTIPSSVTSIGANVFYNCLNLTSANIPDSVKSIGDSAFRNCSSLKTLVIGKGVTSIPYSLLNGCGKLESLTIPFVGCDKTKAEYPSSQTLFGYIFGPNKYDGGVNVDQYYYQTYGYTTYCIPTSLKSVTVNGGYLLYGAFDGCDMIKNVTINNVSDIGRAFDSCMGLTNVTIGNGVLNIDDYAFYNCQNISSVVIGKNVNRIGVRSFDDCYSLTSINLPNGLKTIEEYAFYYCTSLETIIIPNSVTSLGDSAFRCCESLTIYCEATSKPSGWDSDWNGSNRPVVWGYTGE